MSLSPHAMVPYLFVCHILGFFSLLSFDDPTTTRWCMRQQTLMWSQYLVSLLWRVMVSTDQQINVNQIQQKS